eukprot:tig00000388_g24809.t1
MELATELAHRANDLFHRYYSGLPFSAILGSGYLLLPDVGFATGLYLLHLLPRARVSARRLALTAAATALVTAALVLAASVCAMDSVGAYVGQFREQTIAPVGGAGPPLDSASAKNIAVFAHISDVHVSVERFPHTGAAFRRLMGEVLGVVRPRAVVATGDLTDAKPDGFVGRQNGEEWGEYRRALEEAGWWHPDKYLDVRGNHDNFNVSEPCRSGAHFAAASVSGAHGACAGRGAGRRHAAVTFGAPGGPAVRFLALDLAPVPGGQVPWNFFGAADREALDFLEREGPRGGAAAHTFLVTHYPLATVDAPGRSSAGRTLAEIVASLPATGHLFGHLHLERKIARRRGGLLELGGADLKTKGRFRLLVLDHDLFSLAEAAEAALLSAREPLGLLARFRHLRVLAYAPDGLAAAAASVDGGARLPLVPAEDAADEGLPLLVAPFDFSALAPGLHSVEVTVTDKGNRTRRVAHAFSVDGTVAPLTPSFPNFLLSTNARPDAAGAAGRLSGLLFAAALAAPRCSSCSRRCGGPPRAPRRSGARRCWAPGLVFAAGMFYPPRAAPPARPAALALRRPAPLAWPASRAADVAAGEAVASADGTRYALSWACFFLAPLAALVADGAGRRPDALLRAGAAGTMAVGAFNHSYGLSLAFGVRETLLECPAWRATLLAAALVLLSLGRPRRPAPPPAAPPPPKLKAS